MSTTSKGGKKFFGSLLGEELVQTVRLIWCLTEQFGISITYEVINSESIRTQSAFKGFTKKTIQPIFVSVRQLSRKSTRMCFLVVVVAVADVQVYQFQPNNDAAVSDNVIMCKGAAWLHHYVHHSLPVICPVWLSCVWYTCGVIQCIQPCYVSRTLCYFLVQMYLLSTKPHKNF